MKNLIKKITPSFLLNWYHFLFAFLGAVLYGFPACRGIFLCPARRGFDGQAGKIKVIGVTGTNGKTTVINLTTKILEEAGFKVASLSSIKFKIAEKEWENTLKMTMPGRMIIQKFLRQAVRAKCQYAVLEVTSEGIKQHRHRFIDFSMAVLTNLTPEHIEAHGGFENYRKAKGELFKSVKNIHIVNTDDDNAEYFLRFPAAKKYTYGINNKHQIPDNIRLKAENIQSTPEGIKFSVNNIQFNLFLLGGFNIYNALAAVCIGLSQGINLQISKKALGEIGGIPGRMEQIISENFKVFVDYAFTPAALEKVYQTLKPENAKMICVLGACGGGRDKWKRPILGKIAEKYCDEIIITNEDPYDEDPLKIMEDIGGGFSQSPKYKKILDRRKAIKKALSSAEFGDTVVITGKGCESWICLAGGRKISWDDRQIAKEEFKKLHQSY